MFAGGALLMLSAWHFAESQFEKILVDLAFCIFFISSTKNDRHE